MAAADANYRVVCAGTALADTPPGWAIETLRDGAVTLLIDDGGLAAINDAAHALGQIEVSVLRRASNAGEQEEAVIACADGMPLIWVAAEFSDRARAWARERGPMTLLVRAEQTLPDDELARIARFVTLLARQTD